MDPSNSTRGRSGELSWAVSWDADRSEDRQGLALALGVAIAIHAALLLVRIAGETVALPTVDAVVHPRLETLALKRPEPPAPPAAAPETSSPEALRVPVPFELAPPEPLLRAEPEVVPLIRPAAPPSTIAFPASPPAMPETPVRFKPGMTRPVRLAGGDPAYTEIARRAREQGVVILDAVIDETGSVTGIEVIKSLRFGLTESAVRAVGSWRFRPATLDGRPLAVRYTLTVRFALR